MNNESMVYLNKIFTNVESRSCPLLRELIADGDNFDQQLSFFDQTDENGCSCGCSCGCGCGCNNVLDFDDDLTFVVDTTKVFINDFNLVCPNSLEAGDVTVDGIPVDALDFFNERFMASTNNLMARISDCECLERGVSTRGMLLIRNAGNWKAKLTIVLRGSVFGCGGCKRFKLVMTTRDGVSIDIPGNSTFAVTSICLPCTTGGIAPVINFSFDAKATLLNPTIVTDTGGGTCNVIVTGALVTEPIADIQVTRQTLFSTRAEIIEQPCDDTRRCNQFPGTCNCVDDADDAFQLRNRCCNDGNDDDDDDDVAEAEETGTNGCSRNRNRDRDNDRDRDRDRDNDRDRDRDNDNGCGCGCQNNRSRNRQISCQFNGCNGCSF